MSKSTEIKICGIVDDICMNAAFECEVEYIGLVFYSNSPRNVSIRSAERLLLKRNQHSKIVALTVDPDDELIFKLKEKIQPDYIQLHGKETPSRCEEILKNFNLPIIKSFGINKRHDLSKLNRDYNEFCDIYLLDAPSKKLPGGNGEKFNWEILKDYKTNKNWMLAGGINIRNVESAIKITNAPAIDISSGVEIKKGIKTPTLIRDFVFKCRKVQWKYYDRN